LFHIVGSFLTFSLGSVAMRLRMVGSLTTVLLRLLLSPMVKEF